MLLYLLYKNKKFLLKNKIYNIVMQKITNGVIMKFKNIFFIFLLFLVQFSYSQKKVLDHSIYEKWKTLQKPLISNNGRWVAYEINPLKGDGWLYIYDKNTKTLDSFPRGYDAQFTFDSNFLIFKVKPQEKYVRKLKLKKTKQDDLPKDSLFIYSLVVKKIQKYPDLYSLILSKENTPSLVLAQYYQDTTKNNKKKKFTSKYDDVKNYKITYLLLNDTTLYTSNNVNTFALSENGEYVVFNKFFNKLNDTSEVNIFNLTNKTNKIIFNNYGLVKNLTINKTGDKITFYHTSDTTKIKRYKLFYYNDNNLRVLVDTLLPDNNKLYEVNSDKKCEFSENSNKLYLYISPKKFPKPEDTLLDEEKYKVDVWNWKDDRLQTQQLNELKKDKDRAYLAVYDLTNNEYFQLEDSVILNVKKFDKGNADFYLGLTSKPYWKIFSWEEADYKDVYFINSKTKTKNKVLEKIEFDVSLSPKGNNILYYNTKTKSYFTYNVNLNKAFEIINSKITPLFDEEFDKPKNPDPYGFFEWSKDEDYVLIYDRYDIWKVSPENKFNPIKLTNGRKDGSIFRVLDIDRENDYITTDYLYLKSSENEYQTEKYWLLDKNGKLNNLYSYQGELSRIIKSKETPTLLFSASNYLVYPDLLLTDTTFKTVEKISNTNPQQSEYLWGKVELFKWKDEKGKEQKGLLYLPENFDPKQKYPMIVYYYEKYTQDINRHYIPNPSRSVINFPLYNSNGYVIFIPDLSYKIGMPGKSALEIVLSGTKAILKKGFVDKNKLGLQGQSWGGYQTAYFVTQTNMFKAAMAGAPVSNMTSAYGGIRWESGLNRIFQYEQGQSRIGGTLWDKFDKYIENSPLFFANKVQTPLLIMANDNDGAVPYQEGIQYFVALRRLNKPVWLLNYNGDAHNLLQWPNRVDLSIRMMQFFDHFLKDKPAPIWMKDGIPAIKKGEVNGYDY